MIPLFAVHVPQAADAEMLRTLHSGYLSEGPRVKEFEVRLSELLENPYGLALNSGTSALTLALRLAGVGPGTEVISTPMTCTATNLPIVAAGARIVWADINPLTGNIDVDDVARRMSRYVKAVMVVDWGGNPVDVARLRAVVGSGVQIIEDAAHAFGARRYGRPVGAMMERMADFTCFSFQAIKHITTGDGGLLVCARESDYERGKKLRWFGLDREYRSMGGDNRVGQDIEEWGYKFHMNDLAATLGLAQLKALPWILGEHRAHARRYDEALDLYVYRRPARVWSDDAVWLYTVLLPTRKDRVEFMRYMDECGIATSQVHGRCDTLSVFRHAGHGIGMPNVGEFMARQVSIPVHWKLTDDEQTHIIRKMTRFSNDLPVDVVPC